MYITSEQLADRPGATELSAVATPEREPIVQAELMDATLRDGDRTPWSVDEVAIADAAMVAINDAVTDADSLIDGYLANRYPLPMDPAPKVLTVWARAITRYLLHKDRESMESNDPILRDYRDALKLLGQVSAGKLTLGARDPTEGSNVADVHFAGDGKVFGRQQMKGAW